jgi:hypothetical protein
MTVTQKEIVQRYEALGAAVKKILIEWDPIGVLTDGDWPDDEYDSYIPSICSILMNASDVSALDPKLNTIVELNMGLGEQRSRNKEFAARLWKLRDEVRIGPAGTQRS